MLKRKKLRYLSAGSVFYINGRRYKCYGRVIRDKQVFVAAYEDRMNGIRKLNYLNLEMEVLVDGKADSGE